MNFLLFSIIVPVLLLVSACVATQDDVGGIYARQNRIEAKVKQLSDKLDSIDGGADELNTDPNIADQVFQLEVKIYDVEQKLSLFEKQLNTIIKNGEIESFQLPRFPDLQNKDDTHALPGSLQDNAKKQVKGRVKQVVRTRSEQKEKSETKSEKNPEAELKDAYRDTNLGKYASARRKFRSFMREYPSSQRGADAAFMIADSYYKEGLYEEAVLEYQEFIDKHPNDSRVPLAYLRQPLSLMELGKKEQARLFLEILIDKYPKSREANEAKKLIPKLRRR